MGFIELTRGEFRKSGKILINIDEIITVRPSHDGDAKAAVQVKPEDIYLVLESYDEVKNKIIAAWNAMNADTTEGEG